MWKWLNHGANRCESVVRLDLSQRQMFSTSSLVTLELSARATMPAAFPHGERATPSPDFVVGCLKGPTSFGGDIEEVTPDPFPNSEVKLFGADGTAGETQWESRTPPDPFSKAWSLT